MNSCNRFFKIKHVIISFALLIFSVLVAHDFGYVINLTESLPQRIFLVHLNKMPKVKNYVLFKTSFESGLPSDTQLIKQVLGGPGDIVTRIEQNFFINGKWVAIAKTNSLKGDPLISGPIGKLKEGQYYVGTTHPDSFDSRYERIGWITQDLIVGVAYPLW